MNIVGGIKATIKLMFGSAAPISTAETAAKESSERVVRASREFIQHQDVFGNLVRGMKGTKRPCRKKASR